MALCLAAIPTAFVPIDPLENGGKPQLRKLREERDGEVICVCGASGLALNNRSVFSLPFEHMHSVSRVFLVGLHTYDVLEMSKVWPAAAGVNHVLEPLNTR